MERDQIEAKVKDIISEQTYGSVPAKKITLETNMVKDLGLDSLDLIEVVMKAEEAFNIEIRDDDLKMPVLSTVGGFVDLIDTKLNGKEATTICVKN